MVTLNANIAGNQVDLRVVMQIMYNNETYSKDMVLTEVGEFTYGNDNDDNESEVSASEVELSMTIAPPTHTALRTIINLLTRYDTDVSIYMTRTGQAEFLYFRGSVERDSIEYDFKTKSISLKTVDAIFKNKGVDITPNNWLFNTEASSGNIHYPGHYWIRTAATNNRLADGFYRTLLTDSTIAFRSANMIDGMYKYATLAGLNSFLGDPIEYYIALRNTYYFLSGESLCPKTIAKTLKSIAANFLCTIIPYHSGRIFLQQRFPVKSKVTASTLISEGSILDSTVRIVPAKKGVQIKVLKPYFNSSGGGIYDIVEDTAQSINITGNYSGNEIETTEIFYNKQDYTVGTISVGGLRIVRYAEEVGTDVRTLTAYPVQPDYLELVGETTYYSSLADLFYRRLFQGELIYTRFIYELELAGTNWDIEKYYRLPYDISKVYRVRKIAFDYLQDKTKISLVEFQSAVFTLTEEEPPAPSVDDIIMTDYL